MNSASEDFSPLATFDDGSSCNSRRRLGLHDLSGCLDPFALTYDSHAVLHAQEACTYVVSGCTHSAAANFLSAANHDTEHSSCVYPVFGCTVHSGTLNFDSEANVLRGCVYRIDGCSKSDATNYFEAANTDDQSCVYEVHGCTHPDALNYDSSATIDTDCIEPVVGCMDSLARNFAHDANLGHADVITRLSLIGTTLDEFLEEYAFLGESEYVQLFLRDLEDAICTYTVHGCMSPAATNYAPQATLDDGSCLIQSPFPVPPPPSASPSPPTSPPLALLLVLPPSPHPSRPPSTPIEAPPPFLPPPLPLLLSAPAQPSTSAFPPSMLLPPFSPRRPRVPPAPALPPALTPPLPGSPRLKVTTAAPPSQPASPYLNNVSPWPASLLPYPSPCLPSPGHAPPSDPPPLFPPVSLLSLPWAPSPPGPPFRGAFTVQTTFIASGQVDDYGTNETAAIASRVAQQASVAIKDIGVSIEAASVLVTVNVSASDAMASLSIRDTLQLVFANATSASSLLGIQVEAVLSSPAVIVELLVLVPSAPDLNRPPSPTPAVSSVDEIRFTTFQEAEPVLKASTSSR